jgi:hypothetical protein
MEDDMDALPVGLTSGSRRAQAGPAVGSVRESPPASRDAGREIPAAYGGKALTCPWLRNGTIKKVNFYDRYGD